MRRQYILHCTDRDSSNERLARAGGALLRCAAQRVVPSALAAAAAGGCWASHRVPSWFCCWYAVNDSHYSHPAHMRTCAHAAALGAHLIRHCCLCRCSVIVVFVIVSVIVPLLLVLRRIASFQRRRMAAQQQATVRPACTHTARRPPAVVAAIAVIGPCDAAHVPSWHGGCSCSCIMAKHGKVSAAARILFIVLIVCLLCLHRCHSLWLYWLLRWREQLEQRQANHQGAGGGGS